MEPPLRVTFGGITALLLARRLLAASGWEARVVAAPRGGSPCGMALEVPRPRLAEALDAFHAAGLSWVDVRTAAGEPVAAGSGPG